MNAAAASGGSTVGSATVRFDASRFPLVTMTFLGDQCTEGDLDVIFANYEELWKRSTRFVLVIDGTTIVRVPTAKWRQKLAEWERTHAAQTTRWNAGAAVILPNPLVRGCMTAVEWLFKPATERAYFKDVPSSRAWVLERLAAENQEPTTAMERYFAEGATRRSPDG